MNNKKLKNNTIGLIIIIFSSFINAVAQFLWKYSHQSDDLIYFIFFIFLGFSLYGISTLTITKAFQFGDYSILHPSLSITYIFSSIIAYFFLNEIFTTHQIIAIILICLGVIIMGLSKK